MTEREQMVKEMIDELGGLLHKDEALIIMPGKDGEVFHPFLTASMPNIR